MAYRRTALVAVGGFDERFRRAFREDSDLALRLTRPAPTWCGESLCHPPVRPAGFWARWAVRGNADDMLMWRRHGASGGKPRARPATTPVAPAHDGRRAGRGGRRGRRSTPTGDSRRGGLVGGHGRLRGGADPARSTTRCGSRPHDRHQHRDPAGGHGAHARGTGPPCDGRTVGCDQNPPTGVGLFDRDGTPSWTSPTGPGPSGPHAGAQRHPAVARPRTPARRRDQPVRRRPGLIDSSRWRR